MNSNIYNSYKVDSRRKVSKVDYQLNHFGKDSMLEIWQPCANGGTEISFYYYSDKEKLTKDVKELKERFLSKNLK